MTDPRRQIRFRTFVDNELVDEAWAPEESPESIAEREGDICAAARAAGKDYRVELYDPDLPPTFATMRVGSSPEGMVNPEMTSDPEELERRMMEDYKGRIAASDYFKRTTKPRSDA